MKNIDADANFVMNRELVMIATQIKKKRLELSMNQSDFANYMQVSQAMISKWESGSYNFTIDTLVGICSKLKISFTIDFNN